MAKLRSNMEILSDPAFKRKFKRNLEGNQAQEFIFDLLKIVL